MIAKTFERRGPAGLFLALFAFCLTAGAQAETETRKTEPFHAVSFEGSWTVDVTVGKENSVVLEGNKDTLAKVTTEVVDGQLRVRLEHSTFSLFRREDTHGLVAHVTLPQLTAFALAGSGDASVTGLNGGKASFALDGSGDLKAVGKLDSVDLVVNGSGDADLSALQSAKASAVVNGSGDAVVNPTDTLAAVVNGSGRVKYLTEGAKVTSVIHGSGMVEKR